MKPTQKNLTRKWISGVCAAAAVLIAFTASAQIITLTDNNSVAKIDVGSQAGMNYWAVQGQNMLNQQWFWYRVGQNPEASIDTISPATVTLFNGTRGLSTYYANNLFGIRVDYLLSGGPFVGVGEQASSDIGETITIYNTSSSPLEFSFFQYSDFNLGDPLNDTVQLGKNLRGLWNEAVQVDNLVGLTETVTALGANHGEAGLYNATLVKLNDGVASNLSDVGGPVGPGDATWALQWDFLINPGGYVTISKDKYLNVRIVPEPGTVTLLALGLAGLAILRRRQG